MTASDCAGVAIFSRSAHARKLKRFIIRI